MTEGVRSGPDSWFSDEKTSFWSTFQESDQLKTFLSVQEALKTSQPFAPGDAGFNTSELFTLESVRLS